MESCFLTLAGISAKERSSLGFQREEEEEESCFLTLAGISPKEQVKV